MLSFRAHRAGIVAILGALIVDQATKKMALTALKIPGEIVPVLPMFDLTLVFNHGISFGLFNETGPWNVWIFTVISSVLCVFLAQAMECAKTRIPLIAFGLMIGGAMGNVIDRWVYGAVVDFLSVHYNGHYFPVFNGADAFISIGVFLIIIESIFKSRGDV